MSAPNRKKARSRGRGKQQFRSAGTPKRAVHMANSSLAPAANQRSRERFETPTLGRSHMHPYIASIMLPHDFRDEIIPDCDMDTVHAQPTEMTDTIPVKAQGGATLSSFRVVFTPHTDRDNKVGRFYGYDVASGTYNFLKNITTNFNLSDDFSKHRTVSGAMAIRSSTTSTTNASLSGLGNLIQYQDAPDFRMTTFETATAQKRNPAGVLEGFSLADGAESLVHPFGKRGLEPGNTNLVTNSQMRTLASAPYGPVASDAGWDLAAATSAHTLFDSDNSPGFIPPNAWGRWRVNMHLEVAFSAAPTTPDFEIMVTRAGASTTTWALVLTNTSYVSLPLTVPAVTRLVSNFGTPIMDDDKEITRIAVTVSYGGGGTSQIDSVNTDGFIELTSYDYNTPNMNNGSMFSVNAVGIDQNVSVTGVMNNEVIPTQDNAKLVTTSFIPRDPGSVGKARQFMAIAPHMGLKFVYSLKDANEHYRRFALMVQSHNVEKYTSSGVWDWFKKAGSFIWKSVLKPVIRTLVASSADDAWDALTKIEKDLIVKGFSDANKTTVTSRAPILRKRRSEPLRRKRLWGIERTLGAKNRSFGILPLDRYRNVVVKFENVKRVLRDPKTGFVVRLVPGRPLRKKQELLPPSQAYRCASARKTAGTQARQAKALKALGKPQKELLPYMPVGVSDILQSGQHYMKLVRQFVSSQGSPKGATPRAKRNFARSAVARLVGIEGPYPSSGKMSVPLLQSLAGFSRAAVARSNFVGVTGGGATGIIALIVSPCPLYGFGYGNVKHERQSLHVSSNMMYPEAQSQVQLAMSCLTIPFIGKMYLTAYTNQPFNGPSCGLAIYMVLSGMMPGPVSTGEFAAINGECILKPVGDVAAKLAGVNSHGMPLIACVTDQAREALVKTMKNRAVDIDSLEDGYFGPFSVNGVNEPQLYIVETLLEARMAGLVISFRGYLMQHLGKYAGGTKTTRKKLVAHSTPTAKAHESVGGVNAPHAGQLADDDSPSLKTAVVK